MCNSKIGPVAMACQFDLFTTVINLLPANEELALAQRRFLSASGAKDHSFCKMDWDQTRMIGNGIWRDWLADSFGMPW